MQTAKFETWAIIEIMGHQKYAGYVTEQSIGGSAMVRVDVPGTADNGAFSKLFGVSSIYCITPVTEEVARAMAGKYDKRPLAVYDLPSEWQEKIRRPNIVHQLPECSEAHAEVFDDDEGEVF